MIKAIFAVDSKQGIGKNGTLPWPKNSEDLKHFSRMTTGHIVVMGSKTWEDPCFPSPLKNRDNFVISHGKIFHSAVNLGSDFKKQLISLQKVTDKDIWIIGGASIINQCFDIIEEIHVSVIEGDFDCDTFINIPDDFKFLTEIIASNTHNITYKK